MVGVRSFRQRAVLTMWKVWGLFVLGLLGLIGMSSEIPPDLVPFVWLGILVVVGGMAGLLAFSGGQN